MKKTKKGKKTQRIVPYGFLAGFCSIFALYLTVAVVAVYLVMDRIEAETQSRAGLFDTWWQTLLFILAVFFVVCTILMLVMKLASLKSQKRGRGKMNNGFKNLLFNKTLWSLSSIFFALTFAILSVGQLALKENEGNINYALGITTWEQVTSEEGGDSEYFKSPYMKADGTYDDKAMRAASMAISRKAAAEGMVLLWNNDNALPLAENEKLSFFGVSSKANNWHYTGHGSGRVTITPSDFPDLKATFESEGKYTVNPTLWNSYANKQVYKLLSNPYENDRHYREFKVGEKAWSQVESAAGSSFAQYGDAAIYFIGRSGGEDADTWFDSSRAVNASKGWYDEEHTDNNYLDLTKNERDTLAALSALKGTTFNKIILVLNTGAAMNMQTIKDYDIDACLWAGMGGNASFSALYDVMSGAVNPSGRLIDTYVYNNDSAPSAVNTGPFMFTRSGDLPADNYNSNSYNHHYIVYQEGIYVGYRYYETRYEDSVLGKGNAATTAGAVNSASEWKYQEEVAFPFGYGLSYTDFQYSNYKVTEKNGDYHVSVTVTNIGTKKGSTPVQIYLQKPYTDYDKQYNIEKASVELVGYTKTDVLNPGQSKEYTVVVDDYEFKTYDAYNKKTYILEKGDYYLAVGKNAHDALNNILDAKSASMTVDTNKIVDEYGKKISGDSDMVYKKTIADDDYVIFSKSPTGHTVTNQFDTADINIYEGTADQKITYLSRDDWQGTYPQSHVLMQARNATFVHDMQTAPGLEEDPNATMPIYDTVTYEGGALSIIMLKDLDYDNELWYHLLNQMTWEENIKLCGIGNHVINAVQSVVAPEVIAQDGPAGVKVSTTEEVETFMAFPAGVTLAATFNDALVEDVMEAFGLEMLHSGCGEIYGTGTGVHRSAYGGRNWEYFSEDGFISGKILVAEVKGLQSKGAIINIKHFVLNDQEIYRCGTATFANEQAIREIYLKAFEAGVTEGHANGVMSSLNRIGPTWAGRHKGLLTEVLRNEWGFMGFVETDAASGNYMSPGPVRAEAVVAGNDLWLAGNSNATVLWGDYKDNATVCTALRESAHRLLYTVLHSFSMNGIKSSTRFVYNEPFYYGIVSTAQTISAIVAIVSVAMFALSLVLNRDKSRKTNWTVFMMLLAIILAVAVGITGVFVMNNLEIDAPPSIELPEDSSSSSVEDTHECESACPECGYCMDLTCTSKNCAVKCGDSKMYDETFNAIDLNVAKSGVTVKATDGYVEGFSKANNSSAVFSFKSAKADTVTLTVSVSKNAAAHIFTDNVDVLVNGVKLDRSTVVPALEAGESDPSFVEINLGCINVVEGENTIVLKATGENADYDLKFVKVIGDSEFTPVQAIALEHDCTDVCTVCGGCTNFSCLNPGCADKCICESGAPATIFSVLDFRVSSNQTINKEYDGIGCTWNQTTTIQFTIVSSKAGTVKLGAVTSKATPKNVLFTTQVVTKVNDAKITGTGTMPVSSTTQWNSYEMIVVGEIELKEGKNVIHLSHTPKKVADGGTGGAYNIQSIVIFGNDYYAWYEEGMGDEHDLTYVAGTQATCTQDGVVEHYKCETCNKFYADENGYIVLDDVTIKAEGHKYLSELLVTGAKTTYNPGETFSKDGLKVYIACKNCDEKVEVTDYTLSKTDALTAADTNITISCEKDGVTYAKTIDLIVSHVHQFGAIVEAKDATCTENGNVAYYNCSVCGKNYADTNGENEIADVVIPALGHEMSYMEAKAATCQETGNVAYYNCSTCNKNFVDELGEEVIEDVTLPVDTLNGHTELVSGTKVSCTLCDAVVRYDFSVFDERLDTNRAPKVNEGLGCTWKQETRFTYNFKASQAGKVTFVAQVSQDRKELLFTDVYKMYLNGSDTPLVGTGYLPKHAAQSWTTYDRVVIGEFDVVAGENALTFSFTPVRTADGGLNVVYNFLTFSIIGEGEYEWASHICESKCETCGGCKDADCTESYCTTKCTCSVTFTFNGMDDEIVVTGYPKNETELCISGRTNVPVTAKFTVTANKAGSFKLYLNESAPGNSAVAMSTIFTLTINGTPFTSTEYAHAYDSSRGASSRFFDYLVDYYGEVQLVEGDNEIVLVITGVSPVNVKDFIFVSTDKDAVLTYKGACAHSMTETMAKAATCTEEGNSKYYTCSKCGKYFSDEAGANEIALADTVISALGHATTKVEAKSANCTEDGNVEYYTCGTCGKYFSDEAGANEIALADTVIKASGHTIVKVPAKDATATENGNIEYFKCKTCSTCFSDAEGTVEIALSNTIINAKGHTIAKVDAKAATCTENGNETYYYCSDCGKYFSDELGDNEVSLADVTLNAIGHSMTKTDAKEETCTENGNIEYYACANCGKYYRDEAGETEVALEDTVIDLIDGHTEETVDQDGKKVICSVCGKVLFSEFSVLDSRVDKNRAAKYGEGIGCTWKQETKFTYVLIANKASKVTLAADVSQNTKEVLFTDVYKIYLNGSTTPLEGTGYIPKSAAQSWTKFDRVVIGEFDFVEGENVLEFSFTPLKTADGGLNVVYNFLTLIISGDGAYTWAEHACLSTCIACGACTNANCQEAACQTKCTCVEVFVFNGMDEEIVVTGYPKNETELCIPGRNNTLVTTTFTINASKAGAYKLYLNSSANTSAIAMSTMFSLSVNSTAYTSEESGHAYDSSRASSRFFDYTSDYYGEVELTEGNNEIVFVITGTSPVNVKDFYFVSSDATATLTYATNA